MLHACRRRCLVFTYSHARCQGTSRSTERQRQRVGGPFLGLLLLLLCLLLSLLLLLLLLFLFLFLLLFLLLLLLLGFRLRRGPVTRAARFRRESPASHRHRRVQAPCC
ncbi:unnamed protein product [Polarella glacialis]|uniref:Uncharacterized protein n=1 Tax=Polarella glacialis TaxID=89957 RepID=A0A813DUA5_POLGL|nr:unnamed protein product [Polarella glacialis]